MHMRRVTNLKVTGQSSKLETRGAGDAANETQKQLSSRIPFYRASRTLQLTRWGPSALEGPPTEFKVVKVLISSF